MPRKCPGSVRCTRAQPSTKTQHDRDRRKIGTTSPTLNKRECAWCEQSKEGVTIGRERSQQAQEFPQEQHVRDVRAQYLNRTTCAAQSQSRHEWDSARPEDSAVISGHTYECKHTSSNHLPYLIMNHPAALPLLAIMRQPRRRPDARLRTLRLRCARRARAHSSEAAGARGRPGRSG